MLTRMLGRADLRLLLVGVTLLLVGSGRVTSVWLLLNMILLLSIADSIELLYYFEIATDRQ